QRAAAALEPQLTAPRARAQARGDQGRCAQLDRQLAVAQKHARVRTQPATGDPEQRARRARAGFDARDPGGQTLAERRRRGDRTGHHQQFETDPSEALHTVPAPSVRLDPRTRYRHARPQIATETTRGNAMTMTQQRTAVYPNGVTLVKWSGKEP